MMTPQLQEALAWVNGMRSGPLGSSKLDELPKGVPGHTRECVIARALKMGIAGLPDVQVNNGTHLIQVHCGPTIQGNNPNSVQKMIKRFDGGALPELIDYESYRKMDPNGSLHLQVKNMAKPFDTLLPTLAKHYPELDLNPGSMVEVAESFATMSHVVTVKNPGQCPKAVHLTATMLAHMQKRMEDEMWMAIHPPMVYDAGKLHALSALKPAPVSQYYAPDWANMMKTPEAPVTAPSEELAVV